MAKQKQKTVNSFSYRLEYAMMQKKFRNCDICEQSKALGFQMGSSTISQYLSGKYTPKQDKIVLLSRILGVPELWLMGVLPLEDIEGSNLKEYGNPQEAALLADFRLLKKDGKELAIKLIRTIADTREYKET